MTRLHTCTQRAVAAVSALSLGMPAVALAEEQNTGMKLLLPNLAEFIPACVAFIIIWFILAKFAWPVVLKMMEDRENKIQGDLDAAEEARTKAQTSVQDAEAHLLDAQREAQDILAQAKRDAEAQRTQIIAEAQASAQAIVAKAHDTVAAERKKAMIELSAQVVDLSVEIAGKVIGDALDEREQRALAEKYLMEVGNLNED